MNSVVIPKGAIVLDEEGEQIAVTVNPLYVGDFPVEKDFEPNLPTGRPWHHLSFMVDGKRVYRHSDTNNHLYLG